MHHYQVILEAPLSDMSVAELTTSAARISEVTSDSIKGDPYLDDEINDIKKFSSMAVSYPEQKKANPYTKELKALDRSRKVNLTGLIFIIKGYAKTDTKEKSVFAKFLLSLIGSYSKLKRSSYNSVSGEYAKFFEKFTDPKAIEALEKLGVKEVYDIVFDANAKFEALYKEKVSSASPTPEMSINDVKKNIADHVFMMLTYIDSKAGRKTPEYVSAAIKINEILSDIIKTLKADKTKSENQAAEEKKSAGEKAATGEKKS